MTPVFWILVALVILVTAATILYIKLRIEPVTEKWALFLDHVRGWRTQGFAFIVFLLGLAEVADPGAIVMVLGPESKGWVTIIIGVCVYLLRQITNTPPGRLPKLPTRK